MKDTRFEWGTLQHPPYSQDRSPCDFHILATWRNTSVDVCFIRTRKCKSSEVMDPSAIYLSSSLELIVSSSSVINVLTIPAITFEKNKFHCHFVAGVRFSFDCPSQYWKQTLGVRAVKTLNCPYGVPSSDSVSPGGQLPWSIQGLSAFYSWFSRFSIFIPPTFSTFIPISSHFVSFHILIH